jgi:hypothetical protein
MLSSVAMRRVHISQEDLKNIRELYEGVMSNASHGLFFKEGSIIGVGIASKAMEDRTTYFETCKRLLVENDWVTDISFGEKQVVVQGSIESTPSSLEKEKPVPPPLLWIRAVFFTVSKIDSIESSTGRTKQAESCPSALSFSD